MRYFSCTIQNGYVYLHYVASAISYQTADEVGAAFNPLRDRRIHSVEESDEALHESIGRPLPLGMIYVAEGLEEKARQRAPGR